MLASTQMITDQPCLPESGGNYNARLKRSVCVCVSARITANVFQFAS